MTDDAWRAKWGTLTRDQAEQVVAQCQASHDAQKACEHHWHSHFSTSTCLAGPNTHRARVQCCKCSAYAWKEWRDEPYTPDGCGPYSHAYRDGPATYAIEYTTVPTIDP